MHKEVTYNQNFSFERLGVFVHENLEKLYDKVKGKYQMRIKYFNRGEKVEVYEEGAIKSKVNFQGETLVSITFEGNFSKNPLEELGLQ